MSIFNVCDEILKSVPELNRLHQLKSFGWVLLRLNLHQLSIIFVGHSCEQNFRFEEIFGRHVLCVPARWDRRNQLVCRACFFHLALVLCVGEDFRRWRLVVWVESKFSWTQQSRPFGRRFLSGWSSWRRTHRFRLSTEDPSSSSCFRLAKNLFLVGCLLAIWPFMRGDSAAIPRH